MLAVSSFMLATSLHAGAPHGEGDALLSRRARMRRADANALSPPSPDEDITWDKILHREIPPEAYRGGGELSRVNTTRWYGSLHDVVGEDGVVLIHVDAPMDGDSGGRSSDGLIPAGILATPFAATDARSSTPQELRHGCISGGDIDAESECPSAQDRGRHGSGCVSPVEQAITDSHRRALHLAQGRDSEWTAIVEDDALPVTETDASAWSEAFASVWPHVPTEAKFVRLGWCTFDEDVGPVTPHVLFDGGVFKILSGLSINNGTYYTGGCTTAYLVHRSIIPRLLDIFPCCSPMDTCLEEDFFYQPAGCRESMTCNGNAVMVSIDAVGSTAFAAGRTFLQGQSGIIVQDNPMFGSFRREEGSGI